VKNGLNSVHIQMGDRAAHAPYRNSAARPVFGGREVTTGFPGTYGGDNSEVFGTSLVGSRSVSFRATLRRLADN
jgi:hypothetical protein